MSSNLLKRNCRHHLILQRVFVVTTETSYQMLEVLFILRSRVGLTSFNKSNPVNFSGEKIKRSFPLCFFFSKKTGNNFKSSQISTSLSCSSSNLRSLKLSEIVTMFFYYYVNTLWAQTDNPFTTNAYRWQGQRKTGGHTVSN